jgi:TonB family protein
MSTATAMCCRVTVVRSSGYAALDDEAMALLERAQPLPPFPLEITGTIRNFTIPIRCRLPSDTDVKAE